MLLLCLQGISYYNALGFFCCCRFGEGYIITVRVQGDIPDLDPLFLFFSEKFPRATLKVGARLKSVYWRLYELLGSLRNDDDNATTK